MPDEKELSIEEIKMLISIESLLPALLNKIETIDKRIDNLVAKINDNVKIVNEYKKAVKTAMDGQVTQNEFNGKIRELTKALVNLLDDEKYRAREKSILENELRDMILNVIKEKSIEKIMKSQEYGILVNKILKKVKDEMEGENG